MNILFIASDIIFLLNSLIFTFLQVPQTFINRVGAIQNSEDRELTQDSRFIANKNFNNHKDNLEKVSGVFYL